MELRATPDDEGTRLDAFLAGPVGSRARAQRVIAAGAVLVDGQPAPKRHLMAEGQLVTVDEPEEAPAADLPDAPYAVPYADEHLLVVDKPLVWLPTGMLLGGALGNVIDRIRDGGVTDFIKLPGWPAFNVADMSITFGVLVLLYIIERNGAARRA